MKLAYLVNQYPQPSQTFIRREIAAIESLGHPIARFTLRRWPGQLVDPADLAEKQRTRVVLGVGWLGLLWAVVRTAVSRPKHFAAAARMALHLSRRGDRGLLYHLAYLAEACVLQRWLGELQIDHLHAHFGTNSSAVALLCRKLGGPNYSFTVHGPEEFDKPAALKLSEKIASAKFVIAISQFGRSQLLRQSPVEHWDKIHVVHCGLDSMFISAQAPAPTSQRRLVCVARLHEQKGIPILLQATSRLIAEGASFHLTLIGDGPLRSQIARQIDELGLKDVIELAGFRSNQEIISALIASRALVLPSFAEGLPVVLMESLALNRPVLSTYVGGITELVEPGVNGWLVPAGSVMALASAMREVLETGSAELARLGAEGAAKVAQNHDSLREAEKLITLISGHGLTEPWQKEPCSRFDGENDRGESIRPPVMAVGATN